MDTRAGRLVDRTRREGVTMPMPMPMPKCRGLEPVVWLLLVVVVAFDDGIWVVKWRMETIKRSKRKNE